MTGASTRAREAEGYAPIRGRAMAIARVSPRL
jgi:hypothetical protein